MVDSAPAVSDSPLPAKPPVPAAPSNGPFPLGKVCPSCGSREYTRVAAKATISFASDRVCKGCGTRYTPPTPLWANIVFIVIGGAMTLAFGLVCIPIALALYNSGARNAPTASPMGLMCPLSLCIVGLLSLSHGIKSILTKR